ncbi:hypothetical protein AX16_004240 [Volvariella volvacea WC 439]|nr:hypothetical protein AX16_004240 [Volvariella volvacea WC 439]
MTATDEIVADGPAQPQRKPTFDNFKVTVIYVLGGPGAGKGTQCARLVEDFHFCHLSAGDLLRAEQQREGSQYGDLIRTCIREGTIVPSHVTIRLLENAMNDAINRGGIGEGWKDGRSRFLIDGFPRKMDQAILFDEEVCLSNAVLYFSTSEEVMLNRILERAKTSGREDDNIESLKKRFVTYRNDTKPVLEYYENQGKVAEVDSTGTIEEVHTLASAVVKDVFAGRYPKSQA